MHNMPDNIVESWGLFRSILWIWCLVHGWFRLWFISVMFIRRSQSTTWNWILMDFPWISLWNYSVLNQVVVGKGVSLVIIAGVCLFLHDIWRLVVGSLVGDPRLAAILVTLSIMLFQAALRFVTTKQEARSDSGLYLQNIILFHKGKERRQMVSH